MLPCIAHTIDMNDDVLRSMDLNIVTR